MKVNLHNKHEKSRNQEKIQYNCKKQTYENIQNQKSSPYNTFLSTVDQFLLLHSCTRGEADEEKWQDLNKTKANIKRYYNTRKIYF